jgi:hypothetical protein
MFGIKTWGSTGIGSTPIKIIDPNSGSRKVRNRKHNFETTVAGGDFRSDRTAGGHQVYQPGDVHKTGGMYFLTSQIEKNVCVCKEPLCCGDPIPSPWNVVSVVYVLFI